MPSRKSAIDNFKKLFINYTQHPYCFLFRYGRSGLYFLLKSLGCENKKVILSSYSCVVVANAIYEAKAIPVFIDNKSNQIQPDWQNLYDAIDNDTVMVIVTHLFGIPQETKTLYEKIKNNFPNVFVLQDCAHSFFCKDRHGMQVTQWGDGALFGLNISKLINSVKGGAITLKSTELTQSLHDLLKKCPTVSKYTLFLKNFQARIYVLLTTVMFSRFFYKIIFLLSNYTHLFDKELYYYQNTEIKLPNDFMEPLDPFSASIGILSFNKYADRVKERQEIAKYYCETLYKFGLDQYLFFSSYQPGATWSHFYVILKMGNRDELIEYLHKHFPFEIGTIMQYSICDLPMYSKLKFGTCPNANNLSKNILNLPMTFQENLLPIHDWKKSINLLLNGIKDYFNNSVIEIKK